MAEKDLKDRKEEIEALVKKAQKGDHDAFAEIYDAFIDPIYRYVFFRVRKEDAEDIVETVFLKVWEYLKKYKKQKNKSFASWVFRIAHNLVVDHYRSDKASMIGELTPNLPDNNRDHNPVKQTQATLDKEKLKVAISKLKKSYQEIIVYKFINELSNKEIASILKKSEGSLRILQFRALKALKRELKELGIDY